MTTVIFTFYNNQLPQCNTPLSFKVGNKNANNNTQHFKSQKHRQKTKQKQKPKCKYTDKEYCQYILWLYFRFCVVQHKTLEQSLPYLVQLRQCPRVHRSFLQLVPVKSNHKSAVQKTFDIVQQNLFSPYICEHSGRAKWNF